MSAVEALQSTLAAEHAAVYVYGVLGARTSQSAQPLLYGDLQASYAEHRTRRDELIGMLADEGAEPTPAEVAYALPEDLDSVTGVQAGARELEASCATTYSYLVASSTGRGRRWAIEALTEAAVRVVVYRGTPEMFPGADDYTDR